MESKVLLVYPPSQLMSSELPRYDGSLGPLYLAGALEKAGISVDILDTSVGTATDSLEETFNNRVTQSNGLIRIGMTERRISEVITNGGYNVVGISSNFTPQTNMALEVARAAKAVSEDILVVAGGVNARALAERFLTGGNVDVVCATEGEKIIVELVRAWERKGRLEVSGTITMNDSGKMMRHFVRTDDTLTNLDELPFPAWNKLPWKHYDNCASAGGRDSLRKDARSASLMTSRGCPFKCSYCHISVEKECTMESGGIGKLRFKSVDRVIEEIGRLKELGVTKIYFEDDSLLAKKSRVKEIFTQVRGMGLKIADVNGLNLIHFLKRGHSGLIIDEEYLELLCEAGLDQIVFPVESASQRIIDKYATGKLNHSELDVVELVRLAERVGITCPINMMIGFPDETEEEIISSIELGRRLVDAGAPYCSLYIPIPFPGSQLYESALRNGYLPLDFDPDIFNWRKPVMENTTVSPERIEELQQWGWRDINPKKYIRERLERNIGPRWQS